MFESRPESKPGWLLRWDGTTLVFEASVIHMHEGHFLLSQTPTNFQFPCDMRILLNDFLCYVDLTEEFKHRGKIL